MHHKKASQNVDVVLQERPCVRWLAIALVAIGLSIIVSSCVMFFQARRAKAEVDSSIRELRAALEELESSLDSYRETAGRAARDLAGLSTSLRAMANEAGNISILGYRPFEGFSRSLRSAAGNLTGLAEDVGGLRRPDFDRLLSALDGAEEALKRASLAFYALSFALALIGVGLVLVGLIGWSLEGL